jgi:transposase
VNPHKYWVSYDFFLAVSAEKWYNKVMNKAEKTTTMDLTKYSRKELEDAFVKLSVEKEQAEQLLNWYKEQYKLSKQKIFGKSSEQCIDGQIILPIFNEAETERVPVNIEPKLDADVQRPKKQKGHREKALSGLQREIIEYRLSPEEQICPECGGQLHEVRPEIHKELEVIPARVIVKETLCYIYSCRNCEKTAENVPMIMAPSPNPVLKGSLLSPSLLADVMTKKFVDGTPLYRQEQEYQRYGLPINRQNMSNWVIRGAGDWLSHLYTRMHEILVSKEVLHADETELEVLNEPGREAHAKSYMWMYRTSGCDEPIILYDYQPSRAGDNAKTFLKGFKGYLHTDAYAGYDRLLQDTKAGPPMEIDLVACFAHARRYFTDTLKAVDDKESYMYTSAYEGVKYIDSLFAIERELSEKSYAERYKERLDQSKSILDAYFAWVEKEHALVLPKCKYGQAVNYSYNQKKKLMNVLKDGRLELSNNRAERSIKPFVIGRKNWLFTNTPQGADSSAITYSIIETAKENRLIPFEYLKYLFEKLPNMDVTNKEEINKLLPWSKELPSNCLAKQ